MNSPIKLYIYRHVHCLINYKPHNNKRIHLSREVVQRTRSKKGTFKCKKLELSKKFGKKNKLKSCEHSSLVGTLHWGEY